MSLSPLYGLNIDTISKERYNAALPDSSVQNASFAETPVFSDSSLNYENTADTFELQNNEYKNTENLYDEFLETKQQQGLIGKAWDGIKNLLHLKNSSNNVENIIKQAQNGEITHDEANERLNAYKEGQKMCVDVVGDIISGIAAVGAAALASVTGGASLLVAAGAGAAVKTAIKASDSVISGREYKLTDLGYDIITGSINGVMAPLSNAIGGAAGTGVAKALGLEAVETCAKSAVKEAGEAGVKQVGKSFLTKLLAKQGASYVAKEGAKGGITLLAAKAAAYGVDMTIDGALSGATDGFARALADGRIEDMPKDMAKGAFGGAIGGLAIGGSTRLIFSGASKINNKLFGSLTESALDINSAKTAASTAESLAEINTAKSFDTSSAFLNLSDEAKNIINSNPQIKAFYSSLDEAAISRLTSEQITQDLADTVFIKGLSVDFSNTIRACSDEANALAAVISKRNSYLQDSAVAQFKAATSGTDVMYFDRPKGVTSTLSKLEDKLVKKTVTSFDEANALIADGVGTRAIFDSLTEKEALTALRQGGLSVDDIKILKNIWKNADSSTLSDAQSALLTRANNLLAEAQTQNLTDRLANAIRNNEINMTEINNYAGEDGIPYFTERQIKELRDAWLDSAAAKNGAEFKVVTKLSENGKLAADLGFSEEYIKSINGKSSKPSGYTACQANFKYSNGALGEGQFRGVEIQKFAEYEHFPYDITKGKGTVMEKIMKSISEGKMNVAEQLVEYQSLVIEIAADKKLYGQYNDYLREVYNFLRKKELGVFDILGVKNPTEPVLNLPGLSAYQNELLSKDCLEALSQERVYNFINPA